RHVVGCGGERGGLAGHPEAGFGGGLPEVGLGHRAVLVVGVLGGAGPGFPPRSDTANSIKLYGAGQGGKRSSELLSWAFSRAFRRLAFTRLGRVPTVRVAAAGQPCLRASVTARFQVLRPPPCC